MNDSRHVEASSETFDLFGWALAAGDFNGDGRDDLVAGVPYENEDAANDGMVAVFYGSSMGLLTTVSGQMRAVSYERLTQRTAGAVNETADQFASALAAGDFDGDGYDDLGAGVPYEDVAGVLNVGAIYTFPGSSGGLR